MKVYFAPRLVFLSIVVILISISNNVKAQKLVFLFGHALYASPSGSSFKDKYKGGIGAEAGIGVGLLGKTFFTGTVGYSDFVHSSSNSRSNLVYIPFKVGVRYYLFAKILFIHGDLGIGKISTNTPDYSASRFSGDIGAGVKLAAFEVLADYDGFTGTNAGSWIGIKAGFSFGL